MKITKYTQSCIVVEKDGTRLLIDPGNLFAEKFALADIDHIDAVLYTHEHADHFSLELYEELRKQGIVAYGNSSTAVQTEGLQVVESNKEFFVSSLRVQPVAIDHCLMPNGEPGPENTGYVIDNKLFHPGDGIDVDNLEIENLALPIIGPDVSMKDAFAFANKLNVKHAIPIHFDLLGAKPEIYANFAERFNFPFSVHVLHDGESIEL